MKALAWAVLASFAVLLVWVLFITRGWHGLVILALAVIFTAAIAWAIREVCE